jgi:hypothetical protein
MSTGDPKPSTKTPRYTCWDEVPWWEKTCLNTGVGLEWPGLKLTGLVGLDKYYPSMFTDTKRKLQTELKETCASEGWDWATFGNGIGEVKVFKAITSIGDDDDPETSEVSPEKLRSGEGQQVPAGGKETAPKAVHAAQPVPVGGDAVALPDVPAFQEAGTGGMAVPKNPKVVPAARPVPVRDDDSSCTLPVVSAAQETSNNVNTVLKVLPATKPVPMAAGDRFPQDAAQRGD